MPERQLEDMAKRPSLFKPKAIATDDAEQAAPVNENDRDQSPDRRPPSRAGKRVLSVYLDPLAWKQLRQLALDTDTTTQALGEEAVNLLFAKHGLNRSA
jgi:Antitoxin-like ribbon-helix-helix